MTLSVKKFLIGSSFLVFIFLSIFFVQRNSQLIQIQRSLEKNKIELTEDLLDVTFERIFIRNFGCFVLLGSKPMIIFDLTFVPSKKERMVLYNLQPDRVRKYVSCERFMPSDIDCKNLWEVLEVFQNDHIGNRYFLTKDESWGSGLFINIPLAMKILEEHYEDFSRLTGYSFDPQEAVYQLGNKEQGLWQEIKTNHYLLGLLLGFGKKNASFFNNEQEQLRWESSRRGCHNWKIDTDNTSEIIYQLKVPEFIVYKKNDEYEKKYNKERDHILESYKGKNFVMQTLKYLKQDTDEENK